MSVHKRHTSLRASALVVALGGIGLMVAQLHPAGARQLDAKCYSDTRCLANAAIKDPGKIRVELAVTYCGTLARLGLFEQAHSVAQSFDRSTVSGRSNWRMVNGDIAVQQVREAALIAPDEIASFEPILRLTNPETEGSFDTAAYYQLAADAILYRSHGTVTDISVANIFRPKMVRRSGNATLTEILTSRWPKAIQQKPPEKQGWDWNNLAQFWLELGNAPLAQESVERAEAVGQVDFQGVQQIFNATWRSWLALGNIPRALQSIDHVQDRPWAARFRMTVSDSLIEAGRNDEALAVIAAALPDVELERNSSRKMELLRTIVGLRIRAGDGAGAHATAEEMVVLAHQRDLVPAAQLSQAAAAFNDLGDHETAIGLLKEAVAKVPGDREKIGVGVTLGPIAGATLGLADSLRSEIAEQLYRARDDQAFNDLLPKISKEYQTRTWGDLCRNWAAITWVRPSDQVCVDRAGTGILVDFATDAIKKGDLEKAEGYLRRAIAGENGGHSSPAHNRLTDAARLAIVMDGEHLANVALSAAAEAADNDADPGAREFRLAEVAALRNELLQQ